MEFYTDNRFIALGDTLLAYDGKDKSLSTLPSVLGGIRIKTIAESAIYNLDCEEFTVPEGIVELKTNAITHCDKLKTVYLPSTLKKADYSSLPYRLNLRDVYLNSLEMDTNQYREIERDSIKGNKGICLVQTDKIDIGELQPLLCIYVDKCSKFIPSEITSLFVVSNVSNKTDKVKEQAECVFSSDYLGITEKEINSIKKIIKNDCACFSDPKTESTEKFPEFEKNVLMTFYPEDTRFDGDKCYVNAHLSIGYHFWQSVIPVTFNKKQYYIYRRCYLTDSTEIKYIIKDMAVIDSAYNILKSDEASDVYGKYKLLSVL